MFILGLKRLPVLSRTKMQLQQQVLTGQNDFMIESTTFAVRLATLSFRKE